MFILLSILALGVLIFVHELGHFLVAKFYNVGVLEFSVGFGKKIWQRRIGETTYAIGLIPLGGYVRMVGDDHRDLTAEMTSTEPEDEPGLEEGAEIDRALRADRSRWFLTQSFWPKAAIVLAGPIFNLIFAILFSVFSFYIYGKVVPVDKPIIGDVVPDYPAHKAGLMAKDLVKRIDGVEMLTWEQLAKTLGASEGREVVLDVARESATGLEELSIRMSATPESAELAILDDGPKASNFKIGVIPSTQRLDAGLLESASLGARNVWFLCRVTVRGLAGMIQGAISPKHISGPIFIFREAARSAKRGFEYLLDFMVFLSVSLAILNLLPIPILDGGHLLFFIIEALKGGPLNLRIREIANQVGMVVLLLLMLFAFGNDIRRFWE